MIIQPKIQLNLLKQKSPKNKFKSDYIYFLDELYKGVYAACQVYGVDLIGGDTTSSLSGTNISITAIGEVEEKKAVKRSGAKENDLILHWCLLRKLRRTHHPSRSTWMKSHALK